MRESRPAWPTAGSSPSSVAPPRSKGDHRPPPRPVGLTRASTKPVLPDSDTTLDEKLELALVRKFVPESVAARSSPRITQCLRRVMWVDPGGALTLRWPLRETSGCRVPCPAEATS